jgi:phosphatidylserine/phosphatidylglycerophosphate/cardiolipin synthase-like enzyme
MNERARRRFGAACLLVFAVLATSCQLLAPRRPSTPTPDTSTQASPIRVYFTTPDDEPRQPGNIAETLASYIDRTRETLDVAAFELDNRVIVAALRRATERGVRVRLVTDTDYLDEHGPRTLRDVGVAVVDDQRSALMHNKFMVFDGQAVWTGSMNFTENCAYLNNNHGLLIVDRKVAENYATKFHWMFDERKFGGKPSSSAAIPYPRTTLADDTPLETYFSTHDKLADRVKAELNQAERSIRFLAFSFTHAKISEAMLAAHDEGVEVSGVFENSQAGGTSSKYQTLKAAGLPVYKDANPRNMHHKFIVIDGQTVIAGSFNYSSNAEKSNDENIVIIRNRAIAERFEDEFRRVRDLAAKQ